ncbi:MAG: hypothetical protein ABH836_02540 [Candidatus Omnitrophota bacterium]
MNLLLFTIILIVSLIATFANSLRPNINVPEFTMPFLHLVFPSKFLPWVNLFILTAVVLVMYKIVTYAKFAKKLTNFLRKHAMKKKFLKTVSFEELVVATGGYAVSKKEERKQNHE